jgi:hypothetical protein
MTARPAFAPCVRCDVAAAALILAACLITRLPYFGYPAATTDEQLYSLVGRAMLAGDIPYVDIWDRKPIGLFLLFALGHLIGGAGPLGYQFLATTFAMAGGWLVYRIALRTAPPFTATVAGATCPFGMALLGSQSGQSEIFWVPLMLAMLLGVLSIADPGRDARSRPRIALAAMLAGGLALQVKYTVAPQCAVLGLAALWMQHRAGLRGAALLREALFYALVGLVPTLLAAIVYLVLGSWDAFLFANFESIFLRGAAAGIDPRIWPLLAFMAVLWVAGLFSLLAIAPDRRHRDHAVVFAWLGASIATLFMGSTLYVYYLAGLVAPTLLAALPFLDQRNRFGRVPAFALLILVLVKYDPLGRYHDRQLDEAQFDALAAAVAPLTAERGAFLFVYDGPTALYNRLERRPPSPLVYPDHFNNALEASALPIDPAREAARLLACRPGAVVTATPAMTDQNPAAARILANALERDYRLSRRIAFEGREIAIWTPIAEARRSCL